MSALAAVTLILVSLLAGLPADASTFRCSGFAPTTTSCNTGSHKRVSGLSQDVAADFNYVGTIETALVWNGGKRVFRCTYSVAGSRTCLASGTFPPVDATFAHRCRSLVPGTAISPAPGLELDGIEGGAGTWQCSVTI